MYDLATTLLGIYPQKTTLLKDKCTPVFIAALFTVARIWNQLRYTLTDEWIQIVVHICKGILLRDLKK